MTDVEQIARGWMGVRVPYVLRYDPYDYDRITWQDYVNVAVSPPWRDRRYRKRKTPIVQRRRTANYAARKARRINRHAK